ncbi:amino acid adenylation domain-containing protein, partial [Marinobacter halodurans]
SYPSEQCIHELFEAQVQRSPEAVALVHGDETLSYGALNARANRLAHYLRELGVGPDDRVAICAERSLAMVVGLLGVLKAGGAYVPLDPEYPAERLAHMLEDSAPVAVLVHGDVPTLATGDRPVIALDDSAPWTSYPVDNPERGNLTPSHLAYVFYTSGSTGLPKGVMIEHRSVVNRLVCVADDYRLDAADVAIQNTPICFDPSVRECFAPLLHGASLVMLPAGAHKNPDALIESIVQHSVTTIAFVPSMLTSFLAAPGVALCRSLRRVTCGGEAFPEASIETLHRVLPGVTIHNLYGPTEACIDVIVWTCPRDTKVDTVPIGRPVANTRIYLLDARGMPVPLGAVGEIYIGGAGVARGYLNRPELTAERFVLDPFSAEPGARLYRTGDLGRYRPDGNIEYLGRNDFQVKIRGFRIELGEVEACLMEHDTVKEAVVLAHEDASGANRLLAYYTGGADVAVLRSHLQAALPAHMVPSAFVGLESLPLTPSGKLDRKALPAPEDDAYVRAVYEAPSGKVEETLAGIWQELLGVERVGRQDCFFTLGGHSLLVISLIERLRQQGLELPVGVIYSRSVLAQMAVAATETSNEVAKEDVPANKLDIKEYRL